MAEYIEREALLKKAIEEKRFVFQMEDLLNNEVVFKTVYKDLAEFILSAPAADVAPVAHGRWVNVADKPHLFYECSLCKERWGYGAMLHMNYCPNCGARMDGAE